MNLSAKLLPGDRPDRSVQPLFPHRIAGARVLAVQPLAGGAGATTLVVNLAWELAAAGRRVCLIDLSLQFGAVAAYLDLPRPETVLHALTDAANLTPDGLIRATQPVNDRLHVFTAPPEMVPLDLVTGAEVGRLIDLAAAQFDVVLIDLPGALAGWTDAGLMRAELCYAVLLPDLRSAQNAVRLIRTLRAEGLAADKLRFVMNRAPGRADLMGQARLRRIARTLNLQFEVLLPDGGTPVTKANDLGLPLAQHAPGNPLRREIEKLAQTFARAQATAGGL